MRFRETLRRLVLLAIPPVAGLGCIVAAAPEVATALGYDVAAALEEPGKY